MYASNRRRHMMNGLVLNWVTSDTFIYKISTSIPKPLLGDVLMSLVDL